MKDKEIRNMDDLGRIVIPRNLRKELIGTSNEFVGKPFSVEKVYSSKDKQWGFLILPIEEGDK